MVPAVCSPREILARPRHLAVPQGLRRSRDPIHCSLSAAQANPGPTRKNARAIGPAAFGTAVDAPKVLRTHWNSLSYPAENPPFSALEPCSPPAIGCKISRRTYRPLLLYIWVFCCPCWSLKVLLFKPFN